MIVCPKCGIEYSGAEKFCPKDGTRLAGDTAEAKLPRVPSLPPDQDPLINKVIQGRYKVLKQIGEGGMGVVYVAEHVDIEKKVALKVLRDDFSKRPELLARFKQEARSASKIGNQHIVDVTDFGQLDNGGVYFVMEYLQGKGLSDVIDNEVIPLERAVSIVLQISRALHAAHKLGIVHRDLKPENIYLVDSDDKPDFVKILDFGIAKISDTDSEGQRLTKTGMIFGTPEYMSPEQAAGKPLDHRVDIYALGCIMFEMFTGQVPFDGESFMAVLTQHMFEPVPAIEEVNPDTDIPEAIKAVVYKAMAKNKDDRYAEMTDLSYDLERCIQDATYLPSASRYDYRMSELERTGKTTLDWTPESGVYRRPKRHAGVIIGLTLIVLLLATGGVAYWKGFLPFAKPGTLNTTGELQVSPEQPTDPKDALSAAGIGPEGDMDTVKPSPEETGTENGDNPTEEEIEHPVIKKISVVINTKPKGAVVTIEGMGQVCSSTPCEVELPEGEPAEITATLDNKTKGSTFTPSPQNRKLTLTLKKTRGGGGGRRGGGRRNDTKSGSSSETRDNGLKIPKIFENN